MEEPTVAECVSARSDAIKLPVYYTPTVQLCLTAFVFLVRVRLVDFKHRSEQEVNFI